MKDSSDSNNPHLILELAALGAPSFFGRGVGGGGAIFRDHKMITNAGANSFFCFVLLFFDAVVLFFCSPSNMKR